MVVRNNTQDVESRFGHLLQPIRDLTKNWNVDIASELEDYLEEVLKCCVHLVKQNDIITVIL